MVYVIGIDPALSGGTGVAVLRGHGMNDVQLADAFNIVPEGHFVLAEVSCPIAHFKDGISDSLQEGDSLLVACENVPLVRNFAVAAAIHRLIGAMWMMLCPCEFYLISPAEARSALCGTTRVGKEDIVKAVNQRFGKNYNSRDKLHQNICDAVGVALALMKRVFECKGMNDEWEQ